MIDLGNVLPMIVGQYLKYTALKHLYMIVASMLLSC